ncbi:MAG: phage tail tip lysozyme [Candidatus Saccharimonadales bacterium]
MSSLINKRLFLPIYSLIVVAVLCISTPINVFADLGKELTHPYYNPDYCSQAQGSSSVATGAASGPFYILGDSITAGATAGYTSELGKIGIQATVNGINGRSWVSGGQGGQTGKQAVEADAQVIQSAKGIIIALGSNGGLGGNPIDQIIDTVRSKNSSAPIWWINTAGTATWPTNLSYLGPFNQALSTASGTKNFKVINWFGQVNPTGDLNSSPTADISGLLADGLHPNPTGYQKLVALVVSSLSTNPTMPGTTSGSTSASGGCKCSAAPTGGPSGVLTGNDNPEKIFRYFASKGLSAEQAAGIAGNAILESSGNPKTVSGSGYTGIFQWDKTSRWPAAVKHAQSLSLDPFTLEAQLDFAFTEATQRKNIEGIKQQSTVDMAAWYWGRFYEGAVIAGSSSKIPMTNVQALKKRIQYAQEILTTYGSSVAGQSPASTTGGASTCTGSEGGTQAVAGEFVFYSQYDPAWKDKPYSTSTIGVSGCGPSAMAMIISTLTGQNITPVETSAYAASQGIYVEGAGSSWLVGKVLAEHWGLKAEPLSRDFGQIAQALQQGKYVITPGAGPKPFSSGGHFIVIRSLTPSGKFLVGDSGHKDTNDKEWDPQQILGSMRTGGIYAISK